jgi:hypothetical protein
VAKKGVLVAQGVYRLASGRVEFTEIGTLGATAPADSEGTTVSRLRAEKKADGEVRKKAKKPAAAAATPKKPSEHGTESGEKTEASAAMSEL